MNERTSPNDTVWYEGWEQDEAERVAARRAAASSRASTSNTERSKDPAFVARASAAMRKRWQDEDYRARTVQGIRDAQTEENSANRSAAQKEVWQRPERAMRLEQLKARNQSSEGRAQAKAHMEEQLQDPEFRAKMTGHAPGEDAFSPDKLSALMRSQELTVDDLAYVSGIPRGRLNIWLSGRGKPRLAKIAAVADALGVPIDALYNWG